MTGLSSLLNRLELEPVLAGMFAALIGVRVMFWLAGRLSQAGRSRRRQVHGAGRQRRHASTGSSGDGHGGWWDTGLLALALVLLCLRPFVLHLHSVSDDLMEPTLQGSPTPQIDGPNDRVVIHRYLFHLRPPRRGELLLVALPNGRETVVRRLIGLPGDVVAINSHGRLTVNGRVQTEPYAPEPANAVLPPRRVPAGHYFTLGDARHRSAPGLASGTLFVNADRVRGRAVAICWPPERARLLEAESQ